MSELRVDPLTGTPVLLVPGRAARPDTYAPGSTRARDERASCPFCPGHEHETPPETFRTGRGEPGGPGWAIRVFPNKFPLVSPDAGDVRGVHEVLVLSPDHDASFPDLAREDARAVLLVARDRAHSYLERGLPYAIALVNHGAEAGASIAHPHAQLVGLDVVPPGVRAVTDRFAAAPDLVRRAIDDAPARDLVVRDGPAVAWCPYASRSPFEVAIAVADAGSRFDLATDEHARAVADALHDALRRIRAVLGPHVPYNVMIDSGPIDGAYHWFVRVTPRVTVTAGFEHTTGVLVNVVRPDDAAAELRAAEIG